MRKPLIPENQRDEHDLRNVYNPNKYNNHIGNYAKKDDKKEKLADQKAETNKTTQAKLDEKKKVLTQISPMHYTGLEPPPPDYQYDVPH
jgi:hypothetical protein